MKFNHVFIILCSLALFAQCTVSKVTITTPSGKEKIKANMSIAIVKAGEQNPFSDNCKSICKDCTPNLSAARLQIDSLQDAHFVFRKDLEFVFDTLTQKEFKTLTKADKKKDLFKVINWEKRAAYVYKIPMHSEWLKIPYDSIQHIVYSYKDECYKGGPLQLLFANPNKIRRIDMTDGFEVKIDYR